MLPIQALYFIAIIPPAAVQESVNDIKDHFSNQFSSRHALKSPPHITLIPPFKWDPQNEIALFQILNDFIGSVKSFHLRLHGFGSFPPRVIYIHVEDSDDLFFLQKALISKFDSEKILNDKHPSERRFKAHMTVAFRDLTKHNFRKAWEKYKSEVFISEFIVNRVSILKHDGNKWNILHHAYVH